MFKRRNLKETKEKGAFSRTKKFVRRVVTTLGLGGAVAVGLYAFTHDSATDQDLSQADEVCTHGEKADIEFFNNIRLAVIHHTSGIHSPSADNFLGTLNETITTKKRESGCATPTIPLQTNFSSRLNPPEEALRRDLKRLFKEREQALGNDSPAMLEELRALSVALNREPPPIPVMKNIETPPTVVRTIVPDLPRVPKLPKAVDLEQMIPADDGTEPLYCNDKTRQFREGNRIGMLPGSWTCNDFFSFYNDDAGAFEEEPAPVAGNSDLESDPFPGLSDEARARGATKTRKRGRRRS